MTLTIKDIESQLRDILNNEDVERDGILNRKSSQQSSDAEVLISHLRILIQNLKHDAEASRREVFELRKLLDE